MPQLDGTGPKGQGQRTGRGKGPCNTEKDVQADSMNNRGLGLGRGAGLARGRGCARRGGANGQ